MTNKSTRLIKQEANLYVTHDNKKFESLRDACIHQARTIIDNDTDPIELFTNNHAVFERAKKLADKFEKDFLGVSYEN